MSTAITRGNSYSATAPSENYLLIRKRTTVQDGTARVIVGLHGHGGDCGQFQPDARPALTGPGYHAWNLTEHGYIFIAIDDSGGANWGGPGAMARMDDFYAKAIAAVSGGGFGGAGTKIGLMPWSMSGLVACNWIKRNPSKVAGALLWEPCTDLDWANATAGYTPSGYAVSSSPSTAEILTAFGSPYSTTSVGYRVQDERASWRGLGVPMKLIHASDDGTVPVAQSQAFVTGVSDSAVTLRSPLPTGDHSGVFANVPASESLAFFDSLAWS